MYNILVSLLMIPLAVGYQHFMYYFITDQDVQRLMVINATACATYAYLKLSEKEK